MISCIHCSLYLYIQRNAYIYIYLYALFSRIAVACEAQQVALEQELLESLPLLYKNQPEQVTMALECKGKGGQQCQGAANISVTV